MTKIPARSRVSGSANGLIVFMFRRTMPHWFTVMPGLCPGRLITLFSLLDGSDHPSKNWGFLQKPLITPSTGCFHT